MKIEWAGKQKQISGNSELQERMKSSLNDRQVDRQVILKVFLVPFQMTVKAGNKHTLPSVFWVAIIILIAERKPRCIQVKNLPKTTRV